MLVVQCLLLLHVNSAADLYIRQYLDHEVRAGRSECRPLRVYYRHRHTAMVHHTVLSYCVTSAAQGGGRVFRAPSVAEVLSHRIIITTLATSRLLHELDLPTGDCHMCMYFISTDHEHYALVCIHISLYV